MKIIPVFYRNEMVVTEDLPSPSAGKPALVMKAWRKLDIPLNVIKVAPLQPHEISRAHDGWYVNDVLAMNRNNGFGTRSEAVAKSLPHVVGSMLGATRVALENGIGAVSPTSGFHHACYDSGGAFCTFNGLMIAAMTFHRMRFGILDFDEHYGNGTSNIIDTLEQRHRIKHYTQGAYDHPNGEKFLAQLPDRVFKMFYDSDILLYQAGADQHIDDPLGGFLTTDQMQRRDAIVFDVCREMSLPVVWNLAGGYQEPVQKVVEIHKNTMVECARAWL